MNELVTGLWTCQDPSSALILTPTMEGHLHGDVRGSGLTPNEQGF